MTALAPVVLDPLFNDFTPLPEGETRSDVLDSRRQRPGSGRRGVLGRREPPDHRCQRVRDRPGPDQARRAVRHPARPLHRDEIRVVVAHELAHVRHRDVLRSVAYAAIVRRPGALAAQRLSWVLRPERGERRVAARAGARGGDGRRPDRAARATGCRARSSGAPTTALDSRAPRKRSSPSSGDRAAECRRSRPPALVTRCLPPTRRPRADRRRIAPTPSRAAAATRRLAALERAPAARGVRRTPAGS